MEQIFESMEKMFQVANIVHGDFSEFNILYFQRRIWVIDVSQVNWVLILFALFEVPEFSIFSNFYTPRVVYIPM